MTLIDDLNFTVPSTGKTFTLQPIPLNSMRRFVVDYTAKYPKPKPPLAEKQIGDKLVPQPDSSDPVFIMQLQDWQAAQEVMQTDFVLAYGVVDTPPDDWQPDDLFSRAGRLPAWQRKAMWLSEHLITAEDITAIIEAIISLNTVTDKGIEEAKKNTPSALGA